MLCLVINDKRCHVMRLLGLMQEKNVAKEGIRCENCGQVNLVDKIVCKHCKKEDGLKGVKVEKYLDGAFKLKKGVYQIKSMDTPESKDVNNIKKIIVTNYKGNKNVSTKLFRAHVIKMAEKGYSPVSQSYQAGTWGCGAFLVAALLCLVIVGFLAFIYMLIVKPEGTLTVTYKYKGQSEKVEEKICPQCAETIKKEAKICKHCRYEFT